MKLWNYLKDTKGEWKHINWPSRKITTTHTVVVIVVSLIVAAFLGAFDILFTKLFGIFIG